MSDEIQTAETAEIKHPRGLTYRTDEGHLSVYDFWLRGRVVLEVVVSNVNPELRIMVGRPGDLASHGVGKFLPTEGRAQFSDIRDEDGDLLSRTLSSTSIRSYVEPRLAVLLARVFVPGDLYANSTAAE